MEYALSYALYNYAKVDESQPGLEYANTRLIRTFDGSPAEAGFILVHVTMVRHSGQLVRHAQEVLEACEAGDRHGFRQALDALHGVSLTINREMETMWRRSSSDGYNQFRTFIMGTKNQPMFPEGVVYEGVSPEPTQYRGESGANDSIIPTLDNLFEVTAHLPSNPLTDILKDFRSYRPGNHNEWLAYVETEAGRLGVRNFALGDAASTVLYLANLDMVREFRMRHWNFTKEYIMRFSKHPVATGGSPITTWLPNQLSSVMDIINDVASKVDPATIPTKELQERFSRIVTVSEAQNRVLKREVEDLKKVYGQ